MKWGLIARSETDRGIGIQTFAMYENLRPDKTLVVIDPNSGFHSHPENYPDATIVSLTHGKTKNSLPEAEIRDWWKDLDVIITVETVYDWDVIGWARADNVKVIIHGNPEFWMATNPQPDVWIWPTEWRTEYLPKGEIVPVPIPDDARDRSARTFDLPLRALHIAGNGAMGDRNGTTIVANAMRRVPTGVKLTLYSQAQVPAIRGARLNPPPVDRWEMYDGQHVLVLPRRYGGLCLPALEAMASGLVVLMPDCPPNPRWPIFPMISDTSRVLHMQTGPVVTYDTPYNVVANGLKHFSTNRNSLAEHKQRTADWAAANRWSVLADRYYSVLDRSCS